MSKWRPSKEECIYVIPDIHGNVQLLDLILDRILPLRKNDQIVFLGDYIDRHMDSPDVVDRIIELKKDYPGKINCLLGNHEDMLLKAMNMSNHELQLHQLFHYHKMWLNNGGIATLVGYFKRSDIDENPLTFPRFRISSIIPKEHIQFYKELVPYYKYGKYIFVHGGMNPLETVEKHDQEILLWDRSLKDIVLAAIDRELELPWEDTIVTGHNYFPGAPIVHDKFMMLDCGSPSKLLVVELNSMEAFMANPQFNRLVKFDMIKTSKLLKKSLIRRSE